MKNKILLLCLLALPAWAQPNYLIDLTTIHTVGGTTFVGDPLLTCFTKDNSNSIWFQLQLNILSNNAVRWQGSTATLSNNVIVMSNSVAVLSNNAVLNLANLNLVSNAVWHFDGGKINLGTVNSNVMDTATLAMLMAPTVLLNGVTSDGAGNLAGTSWRGGLLDSAASGGTLHYVPTANGDGTWTWGPPPAVPFSFDGGTITSDGSGNVTVGTLTATYYKGGFHDAADFGGSYGYVPISQGDGTWIWGPMSGGGGGGGGTMSFDSGTITSDGSGQVTAAAIRAQELIDYYGSYGMVGLVPIATGAGTWQWGPMSGGGGLTLSFDSGTITSDGSGNATFVTLVANWFKGMLEDADGATGGSGTVPVADGSGNWRWSAVPPPGFYFDGGNINSDGAGNATLLSLHTAKMIDQYGSAGTISGMIATAQGDGTWAWQLGGGGGSFSFDGGTITSDGSGNATFVSIFGKLKDGASGTGSAGQVVVGGTSGAWRWGAPPQTFTNAAGTKYIAMINSDGSGWDITAVPTGGGGGGGSGGTGTAYGYIHRWNFSGDLTDEFGLNATMTAGSETHSDNGLLIQSSVSMAVSGTVPEFTADVTTRSYSIWVYMSGDSWSPVQLISADPYGFEPFRGYAGSSMFDTTLSFRWSTSPTVGPVPHGEWVMLTVTWDMASGEIMEYMNGAWLSTSEGLMPDGGGGYGNTGFMAWPEHDIGDDGGYYISDCRIWSTILSSDAVATLYANGRNN